MFLLGLEIVAVGGCISSCSYLWYLMTGEFVSMEVNKWLSDNSVETRAQALVLKSEFHGAEVKPANCEVNHTHKASAAERSTASLLMRRIAEGVGREPYFYQGSGSDARSGRAYSRTYFWAKDLMAPYKEFRPKRDDVICMVDVDYYVEDLEELLVERFQPYMLYTLVPSAAAKDSGDYDYRFFADGQCEYGVAGGGRYTHHIWNWDGDSLRITTKFLGIDVALACYAVERRQMGPDHQVILLAPLVKTSNPLWVWLVQHRLEARRLRRFNPAVGKFVRFYASKPEGLEVVTGICGEYASSSVPASVDSIIASTARTISGKLTRQTVLSKLDADLGDRKVDRSASEVLLEFHLSKSGTKERISLVDSVRRFQWVPRAAAYDEDAKAGMTPFMRPLLHGGFVPDICRNNEERMVEKRIKEPTCKEMPVSKFMMDCMDEFTSFLVPEHLRHQLDPVDVEEVYERQSKPSQRAILEEAEHTGSTGVTKVFIKREAYQTVNDPRGISTICGPDKRDYSQFMYAFTDIVMKCQPWYAFGKSPREVADRVAEVASSAERNGAMKDFSRMDGRHGNVLHFLEKKAYCAAFKKNHHPKLIDAMDKHHHLRARTTFGVRYNTEYHRLSGGADTSVGNTLDTAFIAYLTYRMMGLHAPQAWRKLGIYGGDDGFDTDADKTIASKAASLVGQQLDIDIVERGKPGVAFLARRYGPDVWYGDNNSCCDIPRQLSKFHLTVNLPSNIKPQQKLAEKAFSFALTDRNTPVIGEFVSRALEVCPLPGKKFENVLGLWGVEMDAERQYPNEYADWMADIVTAELPDFDLDRFRSWLRACDSRTVFDPPIFADDVSPDPKPGQFALDGDIHGDRNPGGDGKPAPNNPDTADGKAHYRARKPKAQRNSRIVKTASIVIPKRQGQKAQHRD